MVVVVDSVRCGQSATDFNLPHVTQNAIVGLRLCILGCNQDASSQIIFLRCYMSIDYPYSAAN